jgi:hypothetical protein
MTAQKNKLPTCGYHFGLKQSDMVGWKDMIRHSLNACFGAALLLFSLNVWRLSYPYSDWAALALVPLAGALFLGQVSPKTNLYRARMRSTIRTESPLSGILTGRTTAILSAALFVLIAIPVLAWQALSSSVMEAFTMAILCLVAGLVFSKAHATLLFHFHPPFARAAAIVLGTWLVALAFIPVIAWVNWSIVSHPGEIQTASLKEAVELGWQELPLRRGWIAEILAPFYAFDAIKLWLVLQIEPSRWATILFSLDTALVSFILARASITLTSLWQSLNNEAPN